ncbi:MAG: DNA polymerase sliding clamp [Thermoproteota archaeon]
MPVEKAMTFQAVYPSGTKFKQIVQTIVKLIDEIPFIATSNGLEVKTLTPDKTTMIVVKLPASAFEDYQLDEEKKKFLVPSDELNRVSKRGTRNDNVVLKLDEERRRLEIRFVDRKTFVERTFYIPLREGVVEELAEPQVELSVRFMLEAKDFKSLIDDIKVIGDEAEFIAQEDRIEVRSQAAQKKYAAILTMGNPLLSLDVGGNPPIRSKYSIDLLKASTKAASSADTVTVSYGESLPMRMSYSLPTGGELVYWISPRV